MGRFLNADALASTGQGVLGNNMFAYCNNNPVNAYDYSGESACAIAGGALAGAIISAVSYLIACGLNNDDVTLG